MIFPDRDIKKLVKEKRLLFKPELKNNSIGPASIDLRLGNIFKTFKKERQSLIDIKSILPKDYMKSYKLKGSSSRKKEYLSESGNFSSYSWLY